MYVGLYEKIIVRNIKETGNKNRLILFLFIFFYLYYNNFIYSSLNTRET